MEIQMVREGLFLEVWRGRAGLGLGSVTPLLTPRLTWVISGGLTPAPSLAWSWRWAKGTPSGAALRSWALGPWTTPKCVRLRTGSCSTLRLLHRAAAEPRRGMERSRRNILGERRPNHRRAEDRRQRRFLWGLGGGSGCCHEALGETPEIG